MEVGYKMSDDKEAKNNIETNNDFQDENMAIEFPEWDLMPLDLLLKRGNNENT